MNRPHETSSPWSPTRPLYLAVAFGGVVVDRERGLVLVREVAGGYGDCRWSPLAKGRAEPGETDEQAALREVREELGATAEIVAELAGWWLGTTTATRTFVMRATGPLGAHDAETSSVRWATLDEARELIALSASAVVRARDLAILDVVNAA